MKIWKTGAYSNNCTRFYARKSDTAFWDCLLDATNGDHEFYLDRSKGYVEFGFEFDVMGSFGEWQYSGVFWTAEDSAREKVWDIYIAMYGSFTEPVISIGVNCENRIYEKSPNDGYNHYFKQDNRIRIMTWKTANYSLNAQRVYARKAGSTKWDILLDVTNGDHEIYVDESAGYVEFGFEFDIYWGTDWPYSGVFWTAAQSEEEKVEGIYIEMNGTVRDAEIYIYVNDKKVVSEDWIYSQDQHHWDLNPSTKVTFTHSGTYILSKQELYAITLSGERVVLSDSTSSLFTHPSMEVTVIGRKGGSNSDSTRLSYLSLNPLPGGLF